jgi:protein-tyrosine phosphatase
MQEIPGLSHILDGIYIGKARVVYATDALRRAGLIHVLKLYEDAPHWPDDFVVCDNELPDGALIPPAKWQKGVGFLQACAAANQFVLSVCGAGQSRSVTFVLAYMLEQGWALPDAWQYLQQRHPDAQPNPYLWLSLIQQYHLPYHLADVLGWL